MPAKPLEFIVAKDGTARFIHSEAAVQIANQLGPQTTRRASHVEITADLSIRAMTILAHQYSSLPDSKWWAELLNAEVVLGPFDTKTLALDAEVAWLEARNIPACRHCGEQPRD